jgi:hypothetical protein
MGHERYRAGEEILLDRPPDAVARMLIATAQVDDVHIYGQTITVTLSAGKHADGLKELIEDMYVFYKPGVPVPTEADFS